MENLLRFFLNLGAIYLILDGAIHLINLKLASVMNIWPPSAISYATLMDTIYASFVFLVALLIFIVQKDLKKYKALIFISAIWALIHGFLLIFLSINWNFTKEWLRLPSLYVWLPFYKQYLLFESALAFVYSILVFLWLKGKNG